MKTLLCTRCGKEADQFDIFETETCFNCGQSLDSVVAARSNLGHNHRPHYLRFRPGDFWRLS
jgi:hypothetical protein